MIWTDDMMERARERCRYWQGTPHAHWMKTPGVGIDCIHFIVDVLEYVGAIANPKIPRYSDNIGFRGAENKLIDHFSEQVPLDIVIAPYEFGDILIFNAKLSVNHVALYIDGMVWHALAKQQVDVYPFLVFKKSIRGAMRLK